ncbi:NUDIX domain-containing protein [Actinocrinis puniceicyclus]|uniref:NUDIX domain-containing protein n=1 Tax=Actinocrinis puniceicyclus TaxID=977794 RepID=A0A8J8BEQ2_9ACTN|nr:NUDIX domain-containing protein [Actinocrinis puniceicyclus]MBS2965800.1 NUDIX domain-containing protein [Actinocrinis puniceicyclus]
MAAPRSAGILLFRRDGAGTRVLLVHPGGPFWARRDEGAWSIPKGEYEPDEDPRAAALREFEEELGRPLPSPAPPSPPRLIELGSLRQPGGKLVTAWAAQGDLDAAAVVSNTFELEWPPRSGRLRSFPEIDRAAWFTVPEARVKLLRGQLPFLDNLLAAL